MNVYCDKYNVFPLQCKHTPKRSQKKNSRLFLVCNTAVYKFALLVAKPIDMKKNLLVLVTLLAISLSTAAQSRLYRGNSTYSSDIVLTFDGKYVYSGKSSYSSDIILTFDGKYIYSGKSTYSSDAIATFDGKYVYKGRSTYSSDVLFTYDGRHIYKGRSTYSSDILYTVKGRVPIALLLMMLL